jgi:hypothetical protein
MRIEDKFMMLRRSLLVLVMPLLCGAAQDVSWQEFNARAGGFSVLLPGKPKEEQQAVRTPSGTFEVNLVSVALPTGDATFAVGYAAFPEQTVPPGNEERRLDGARDGAVANVKGKQKAEKHLTLDHHPGREVHIEVDGKTIVLTRFYAVKHMLYQLVAAGTRERVYSKDTERFMASFKLPGEKK